MKAGLVMGHLGCILPPGVGGILRLIFGRSLEKERRREDTTSRRLGEGTKERN